MAKIENGQAQVYDSSNGTLIRSVGFQVESADIEGDEIAVTENGRVSVYDIKSGTLIRSI